MNKKKLIRNVSLVALSAVMVAGTAAAFAGCGKKTDPTTTITVNIFCDATDAATNKSICDAWAEEYSKKLVANHTLEEGQSISVEFKSMADRDAYFTQLNNDFVRGSAADIVYVQPRNVKSWAQRGRIMDLSTYINAAEGDEYKENVKNIKDIWQDVLAFYGYNEDAEKEGKYSMGDSLAYYEEGETLPNGTAVTRQTAGFYTTKNSTPVGVYGLPKDYSNFTMGFNGRYFSDALKWAYMTVPVNTHRNVKGAIDNPANNTYTGDNDGAVVTYAVTGDYYITNPFTGDPVKMHAQAGQPAPLINPGVPVVYKPYNFYAFEDASKAESGGDPVVKAWDEYTRKRGYVITLPGFPGDTFAVPDEWTDMSGNKVSKSSLDANAPYNTNIGHITFTYAEYGALTWAVTYFCNTFNFRTIQDLTSSAAVDSAVAQGGAALSGTSGVVKMDGSVRENVFGNDQYEGAPNPTLYLLPWLAGNDANFINTASDLAINAKSGSSRANDRSLKDGEYDFSGGGVDYERMNVDPASRGGTLTETVKKLRLSGQWEDVAVQYGVNSERFIETFGAFLAYGSDWNGNSGNARAVNKEKDDNGWSLFRNGACVFYGAGTWDNKTKNESPYTMATSEYPNGETFAEWRTMTVPVSERYALYSKIKDAFYDYTTYSAGNSDGSRAFTQEEIYANQMLRQDKWGARMDSVGFALNQDVYKLATSKSEAAWKLQGAADLIMTLSADPTSQHDLTIGGAQLPNFKQQCIELANYQAEKYATTGSFADMVTPEGFSTTKYWKTGKEGLETEEQGVKEADAIWRAYNSVVEALNAVPSTSTMTVQQFFDTNYADGIIPNFKYTNASGQEVDVKLEWDHQFASRVLGGANGILTGELSRRAAAMKILKMVTYTYADRDMQLRMQYGVNAVRDSAMYTYETGWINDISMREGTALCYSVQAPLGDGQTLASLVTKDLHEPTSSLKSYYTPAFFCFFIAPQVQEDLELSIQNELLSLGK